MNTDISLAIIGGSGLYDMPGLTNKKELEVNTPFGEPSSSIMTGILSNQKVAFLARHGKGHTISPSEINYRANIECLKQLEVTDIISLSAVGSLKNDLDPGTFVIIDQFIDRTINRKKTFFENGIVAHVPMANPVCRILMDLSKNILQSFKKVCGFSLF